MTVEELRAKVTAAEEKVEKCKKTIVKHRVQLDKRIIKARDLGCIICQDESLYKNYWSFYDRSAFTQEQSWAIFDIQTKLNDIKGAFQKLADAERICANWKEKLDLEINKEKVIQETVPQIIKDFLEDWKEKAFSWYVKRYDDFLEFRTSLRAQERAARLEAYYSLPEYAETRERYKSFLGDNEPDNHILLNMFPRKPMEDFLKERNLDYKTIKERLQNFGDTTIFKMLEYHDKDERLGFLNSALEEEKKRKLLSLINSITNITGPITDAKHLYVSGGDLNGVIVGEKGVAKIQTFSAGGYNIQCFHWRTRVDDVSDRYKGSLTLDDVVGICKDISEDSNQRANKERSADKER